MENKTYETLLVEKSGPIAVVTINRPDQYNAVSLQLLKDFGKLAGDLRTDLKTHVVIITGAGKAFSSGVDVSREGRASWTGDPQPTELLYQRHGQDVLRGLENLDQITIAAVNGPAVGAGLGIMTHCDFRIFSEKAWANLSETALGFLLSLGCTYSLTALVGPAWAKRLIMTNERVYAQEAFRIGLADKVVPPDQLMNAAMEMAQQIATKAPHAIRVTKKQVNAASVARMSDLRLLDLELVQGAQGFANELPEGLQAFYEKRQPKFREEW